MILRINGVKNYLSINGMPKLISDLFFVRFRISSVNLLALSDFDFEVDYEFTNA